MSNYPWLILLKGIKMAEIIVIMKVYSLYHYSLLTSADFHNPYVPLKIAASRRRKLETHQQQQQQQQQQQNATAESQRLARDAKCPTDDAGNDSDVINTSHALCNDTGKSCDVINTLHEQTDVIEVRSNSSDAILPRGSHGRAQGPQVPNAHGCRSVEGKKINWINTKSMFL